MVVGSGGREHALAWRLTQNATVDKVFAVPGNAGMEEIAECMPADAADVETLSNLAEDLGIDLVVVGPEIPLVAGIADEMTARGLPVFGPTRAAARIEGSKAWAKEIVEKAGAPHPRARAFTDAADAVAFLDELGGPYVVKADGLAAGKGVTVTPDRAAAVSAIEECLIGERFGAGQSVVIEEHLRGEELSVFCLTDGDTVLPLAAAQDYKRVFDGDEGPNTGGMGSYTPVPVVPEGTVDRVVSEIVRPVLRTMAAEGARFRGLLYTSVMVTADGPKVFEFNCRFGDPETQVVIPRLQSDLAELLLACVEGNLRHYKALWRSEACVGVVLASGGYPGSFDSGKPITGLDRVRDLEGVNVFHAGTARRDDAIVTAGGRVLAVSALGADIAAARERAYEAAAMIDFDGKHLRTDIAAKAIARPGR